MYNRSTRELWKLFVSIQTPQRKRTFSKFSDNARTRISVTRYPERNFRGTFPIFLPRCFLLMIRTYRRVSTAFNQWLSDCLPRQREDYVILTDFVVPSISSTDTLGPPNVYRFQRNRIFPLRYTIFRSSRIDRYFSTRCALNQFWKLMLRSRRHRTI